MQIIVLAGGEGKRMWPIQTGKCLIPFLGKPLIYHNLKQINAHLRGGVLEFIIVVSSQTKEEVSRIAQSLDLNFQIAIQNEPKGMADAILSAKDLIEGEVLVVNAEDVFKPLEGMSDVFTDVLDVAQADNADMVFAGRTVDKYFPGGYLKLDKTGSGIDGVKVLGIIEKPGEGNEPSDMVKLVVDYFRDGQKLVEYLQKAATVKDDQYEVAIDRMLAGGLDARFARCDGIWIPLKYPWHILDIQAYFLSKLERQISSDAKVSDKAIIEGNVVIEEGVKVFEGAVIKGPVYLGKNCIVGNNSIVRESNLEEGCVTGFSSDITRSYIGADSWFHTNYIGDSVIEGDFGMGSGAVIANLRLDNQKITIKEHGIDTGRSKLGLISGKGVRIGVNASTMPGVRVGSNCLIGPGVVLKNDLKENKKISLKEESYEVVDYTTSHTSYDQFRDKLE